MPLIRQGAVLALAGLAFVGLVVGAFVLLTDDLPPGSPVEWASFEAEGTDVVVTYYGGACEDSHHAVVKESRDEVMITVYVDRSDGICTADLAAYEIQFDLKSALGDREVVDGGCADRAEDVATCRRHEGVSYGY